MRACVWRQLFFSLQYGRLFHLVSSEEGESTENGEMGLNSVDTKKWHRWNDHGNLTIINDLREPWDAICVQIQSYMPFYCPIFLGSFQIFGILLQIITNNLT